jgi:hypothetical protein
MAIALLVCAMPNESQPYFRPMTGGPLIDVGIPQHDRDEAVAIAAREQMARDTALYGRPIVKNEPPIIKAPVLSDDFAARLATLDEVIMSRGVAIDRQRLVSLGKKRFAELLALRREMSNRGSWDELRFDELGERARSTRSVCGANCSGALNPRTSVRTRA